MGNTLEATILIGKFQSEVVLLPRIRTIPSDSPIPFKGLQFPIRLAFGVTLGVVGEPGIIICTEAGVTLDY
ncbi:hypothetical protein TNCV_5056111 [Trichonephila clavipes]|nr:hypothetical protein TNCV_5056111 [Trichonephila clavipes]